MCVSVVTSLIVPTSQKCAAAAETPLGQKGLLVKVCFLSLDFYGVWKPDFVTPKQIFAVACFQQICVALGFSLSSLSPKWGMRALSGSVWI